MGATAGRAEIGRQAAAMRRSSHALANAGFSLADDIDLRTGRGDSGDYGVGTVAHRLYESVDVPSTPLLLTHLDAVLATYEEIARTRR